ncbi:DUF4124 domain-containing protein [Neisseria sp. Ec49-e6-T10]|uniref:DUF4124 domain-containing protein n=1 Tax=Neisseria sp. Ec49-e6-T10 TaxID=3140744 RepID=UPI003EC15368
MRVIYVLALSLLCTPAYAKLYKWVDQNGKTQYSDRPPVESNGSAVSTMSEQTRIIKKGETQEEKNLRLEKEAQTKKEMAFRNSQIRKDNLLLETYSNVQEIESRRNKALELIEPGLQSYQKRRADLQTELNSLQEQAKQEGNGSNELKNQTSLIHRQIAETDKRIQERQAEITKIKAKYGNDIKRFTELKAQQP